MTRMVSIQTVNRPLTEADLAAFDRLHDEVVGDAADRPEVLVNPKDPTQIAFVGTVHDMEEMRKRSRSERARRFEAELGLDMTQMFYFTKD